MPLTEQLVRAGCEKIEIWDKDKFEESNLNRQLCIRENIGKYKIDVVENFLKKINSEIDIQKFYKIDEHNISKILKETSFTVLSLDDPVTSILIS